MKIYTKGGDSGETGLFGGARVSKTSVRIEAIGHVDEANALLGVCRAQARAGLAREIESIQGSLFELGAELAHPKSEECAMRLDPSAIERLERSIDSQDAVLPPLKNFILPGGSGLAASLHVARAVVRRAERAVLNLHARESVSADARVFLNRLSDWLFVAARTANRDANAEDTIWTGSHRSP